MARVKIELPERFNFSATIPVRITDINYGGHLGNDSVLSVMHEARMQFLNNAGYDELNVGGTGLIMSDAAIEFKHEAFYGDIIIASVAAAAFSRVGFDIIYKMEKQAGDKKIIVALAKTAMICYNYNKKKIAALPEEVKQKLA